MSQQQRAIDLALSHHTDLIATSGITTRRIMTTASTCDNGGHLVSCSYCSSLQNPAEFPVSLLHTNITAPILENYMSSHFRLVSSVSGDTTHADLSEKSSNTMVKIASMTKFTAGTATHGMQERKHGTKDPGATYNGKPAYEFYASWQIFVEI
ncbi:hypothetical protein E4T48_05928 [Aureobasidium sp. EXF-10727]|nr:hypothetical protein E4T48_05928 [Aureobasidium sp. EXF-10727]